MIDIPLNKALVAVERDVEKGNGCERCIFSESGYKFGPYARPICTNKSGFVCTGSERKDRKNVIFKLVDLPEVVRTKEEIEKLEEWVFEGLEDGTHYSGMYYEEGIRNTLNWLFGATEKNPAD